MVSYGMGKTNDLGVQPRRDWLDAQPFKCIYQSVGKAVQAVPVGNDAFALDIIQHSTNLIRREFVVIQERDKARDGALEIDIVLPKRVVGVDEEGLGGRAAKGLGLGGHGVIIRLALIDRGEMTPLGDG